MRPVVEVLRQDSRVSIRAESAHFCAQRIFVCVALAALTACNSKAPRDIGNPKADVAQATADAASAAYAVCVDKAAAAVDVHADQPAVLTDKVMKSCIDARATAVAKVQAAEMARGGDPMITAEVAERSLRVADDELRDRANATIVTRKYAKGG